MVLDCLFLNFILAYRRLETTSSVDSLLMELLLGQGQYLSKVLI